MSDGVATTASIILFAAVLAVSITLIVGATTTMFQGPPGADGVAGAAGDPGEGSNGSPGAAGPPDIDGTATNTGATGVCCWVLQLENDHSWVKKNVSFRQQDRMARRAILVLWGRQPTLGYVS